MKKYDYVIVGAGFFGGVCAFELSQKGKKVLVIEARDHIGGNCFTSTEDNIVIHRYGPHIFHTSNERVWSWINQFCDFNNFKFQPVANFKGEIYSLPFSMWTFNKLWGVTTPDQALQVIREQSRHIGEPRNLEEAAISLVGVEIYRKLIRGYTEKQWRKPARELPPEIIRRLPVRFTFDNNYFNDRYQGIPVGGYTKIFEKLFQGVDLKLNVDYLSDRSGWDALGRVIYTGPIDRLFQYKYGPLEYKTTKFEHKYFSVENFQGTPVMNYTDSEVPYTRIIEHKHFENSSCQGTWVTYEYPVEYIPEKTEPYYPVNDKINNNRYALYKRDADSAGILLGGRLAEYKYYDMHQVIDSALNFVGGLIDE